jgi:collagenase-like protein with putative collagen-binding domain
VKDLSVVYVPQERTLEIALETLPASPTVTWFNPRTGQNNPAVAVVGARSCQFPTPEPDDWLLVMRGGK